MKLQIFLLIVSLMTLTSSSQTKQQISLAVTIYNNEFAMVKDVRTINFDKDTSDLYFTDVSANIQPETVTFKSLTNPQDIKVLEQNFENNLISQYKILEKYIGKEIEIYVRQGQISTRVTGTLLGYNDGYVVKTFFGIQVHNNIDSIKFPNLPDGFFTVPTLSWKVQSKAKVSAPCQVAYRTTGFSWKADYSVTLSSNQKQADIGGWVTIDNRSGKRYLNTKIKLIAGEVNTVRQVNNYEVQYTTASRISRDEPQFTQKEFSDFRIYTLGKPVSLNDNSQKQIQFINKVYNVTIRKYNLVSISSGNGKQENIKAGNRIQIKNTKANKLGIPFPKGTVRVFKTDQADNSLEFVGQDSIDHTTKDATIILKTGDAFDISAKRLSLQYQSVGIQGGYKASNSLTISNKKSIQNEIVVQLSKSYGDNIQIRWQNQSGWSITPLSSSIILLSRVFNAGETVELRWSQDYRP